MTTLKTGNKLVKVFELQNEFIDNGYLEGKRMRLTIVEDEIHVEFPNSKENVV